MNKAKNIKPIIVATSILFNVVAFGQDLKKINAIQGIEQAKEFIKINPKLKAEIIEINSGTDSSEIAKRIYAGNLQGTIANGATDYKILETRTSVLLRASYIYLDGTKFSMNQIDSLRNVIISKFNKGVLFPELVKEYTMDGNPTGDLGWVSEDMLVKEFSSVVKEHKKGDIFTVDVPNKMWYHVVLKTFDDREVKIYSVLKVKNHD